MCLLNDLHTQGFRLKAENLELRATDATSVYQGQRAAGCQARRDIDDWIYGIGGFSDLFCGILTTTTIRRLSAIFEGFGQPFLVFSSATGW